MEMPGTLDAVLARRVAQSAERAAEQRAERRAEDARRPAVEYGEATSQRAEKEPERVNPIAVPEMVKPNEDPPHLIDILV